MERGEVTFAFHPNDPATPMRISRLYVPQTLAAGATVALNPDSAHYLRTVLRLKRGDELVMFNGEGGEYPAVLLAVSRDEVSAKLGDHFPREAESPLHTHLGLGISRGERMDLAIQKAVELGVTAITPLFTERCVVQLDQAKTEQRWHHWQMVARSACEQCGRNRLPELHRPVKLDSWWDAPEGLRLFLHPHGGKALKEIERPSGLVCLLSGPEGGFSDRERQYALAAGFIPLRLGPRILRTETAALAALAAMQSVWGDFS
jgi:16S rRNA (uracil1498-N3)-methyltransferase